MSNLKISQMDYKQLAADDQFPTVNASNPGENKYALAGDIPLLVGISKWDVAASYAEGHTVIYNSSITKGIFLVTTATSAGDSPDGTGYEKFKSISLAFIPNAFAELSGGGGIPTVGYCRTGRIELYNNAFIGGSPSTTLFTIPTSFSETDIEEAKIECTVANDGQLGTVSVRSATSANVGQIAVYLETWGSGNFAGKYIDFRIEL
jgi:hypothetical protein